MSNVNIDLVVYMKRKNRKVLALSDINLSCKHSGNNMACTLSISSIRNSYSETNKMYDRV